MSSDLESNRDQVLDYYARNWENIAHCYDTDSLGLPIDVAWYRRGLYNEILKRRRPSTVLDVGCGGGWTVLDALDLGIDAFGIEPVEKLVQFGQDMLRRNNYDAERLAIGEIAGLSKIEGESLDALSFLSVLPHVDEADWDAVHQTASRVLKQGGVFVAAYRNTLFDLFTFNRLTLEFVESSLWEPMRANLAFSEELKNSLRTLVTNPDKPSLHFTGSQDATFGTLRRVKSNPLDITNLLARHGLELNNIHFYHFHCVPPLIEAHVKNYRQINHELELTHSQDWRGNFMAAMFLVEATKH